MAPRRRVQSTLDPQWQGRPMSHLSRRSFLQAGAASVLTAASWSRVHGANEKLRVAAVGTGGKGWSDINGVAASPYVDYVALCDVDDSDQFLGKAAKKFP